MINLYGFPGCRADERFHLQNGQPEPHSFGVRWLLRRVWWTNIFTISGDNAKWISWTFLWFFHFYHGTAKCDGTQTYRYHTGQLGEPIEANVYVMTTTPKEMLAVRFRSKGMQEDPSWDNMGGC
jgi:hypothetical protein